MTRTKCDYQLYIDFDEENLVFSGRSTWTLAWTSAFPRTSPCSKSFFPPTHTCFLIPSKTWLQNMILFITSFFESLWVYHYINSLVYEDFPTMIIKPLILISASWLSLLKICKLRLFHYINTILYYTSIQKNLTHIPLLGSYKPGNTKATVASEIRIVPLLLNIHKSNKSTGYMGRLWYALNKQYWF